MKFLVISLISATPLIAAINQVDYLLDVFKEHHAETKKFIDSSSDTKKTTIIGEERLSLPKDSLGTSMYITTGYPADNTCDDHPNPYYAEFYNRGTLVGPTGNCIENIDGGNYVEYLCDESNLYLETFEDSECTNYTSTTTVYDFFTDYEACGYHQTSYSYEYGLYVYKCSLADDVYTEAGVSNHIEIYDYSYSYSSVIDPDYGCTDYPLDSDIAYYYDDECLAFYGSYGDHQGSYSYYGPESSGFLNLCHDNDNATMTYYNSTDCSGTPLEVVTLTGGCLGNEVFNCV
eukprot:CAMPEP_0114347948 /NCGR_PEP_ID=MMETSP0101-20121206/14336_1 /TAXON_ID=38822 ORGANISM="Pteridomonas danica, Strain PT" /NCGR_SAMPLE_ID=MMETSP0101 /ASSEMBLY_ACC=CAM_ASM_000211 /LENGTH=288 /DNA_ID=CAMNT_0001485619 /DNA_START=48 /DNA_END=914 /DNA_ORIENTATION=+